MSKARDLADGTFDTDTLVVDAGNNRVGIGTATPETNLHVSSSSNGAVAIVEAEGAYNARLRILSGNANSSFLEFADPDDSDVGEIVYEHANNAMRFNTSGAERLRILSSGGITFNGDTAAANALDDYEEGTWTPTLNVGSVTIQHSAYVKVGNLVTVTSDLTDITETTSTSDVTVSGLPFASASQGRFTGSVMFRYVTPPSNAIQLVPYIGNSANSFAFYWSFNTNSTWDGMQYANANQTWDMYFTLTYRTA